MFETRDIRLAVRRLSLRQIEYRERVDKQAYWDAMSPDARRAVPSLRPAPPNFKAETADADDFKGMRVMLAGQLRAVLLDRK